MRHFLSLMDLSKSELADLIQHAIELKAMYARGEFVLPMQHKVLGMIFEKSSTRTRVSFETAAIQFGGGSIFLSPNDTQLGRGESIEDSARVLSSMVDLMMIRTFGHERVEAFARHSSVPVINALTDFNHPCQLLADVQTFVERKGAIHGATICYAGDGNNTCHSWINAARQFEFTLHIATPKGYEPNADLLAQAGDSVVLFHDVPSAIEAVDAVATDVWASMGQEEEADQRLRDFDGFMIDDAMMGLADKEAIFMHCLPAYRGKEVSASVIDGVQSAVWQEAENRLHAQKALMAFLLLG